MAGKKYCEDCAHCLVEANGVQFARCAKYPADNNDRYVSRQFDGPEEYNYCSTTRIAKCGPEAKWFEPKETVTA